ncbi:MAG: class I SAM-dependent methyltransferase [Thermoleophilia bacterium]|nr:class I SAM-dependent methyltransferase [Thermoleophilia bacterium]MDH4344960.1 class I SAM-dependent methyltransferase [Thermoleophilia bacterium]MDH5334178.1 class I SAM-dependent methyltransferase [Thermoleophilia bacterium]
MTLTPPKWTARRVAAGIGRRLPLRPLRILFPFRPWRRVFRLWLATIRAQPDRRKALTELFLATDDVEAALDLGALDYGGGVHPKHRLTGYHDFFVDRIAEGEVALDVGCGIGSVAHDIAVRSRARVIGIDTSPWSLEVARRRFAHPDVTYVHADALTYAPDEPVDVAVLSNVLEHIATRVALLRSLRERAGAKRVLIRVPHVDRHWAVPLREELGLSSFSDPTHELEYTLELLGEELAAAGWRMGEPTLRWGEIWVEADSTPP